MVPSVVQRSELVAGIHFTGLKTFCVPLCWSNIEVCVLRKLYGKGVRDDLAILRVSDTRWFVRNWHFLSSTLSLAYFRGGRASQIWRICSFVF